MKRMSLALFAALLPTVAAAQNTGIFIQTGPVLDVSQESSFDAGPVASVASLLPIPGGVTGGLVAGPPSGGKNYTTTIYDTGVMAGLDVTVNFTDHLALVPQVRLTGSSYAWNIRPGVALRWRR